MSNENMAGKLILSNLRMINETASLLNTIESNFFETIDDIISDFSDNNNWIGVFKLNGGKTDCWLAPEEWNMADTEDELKPKARFAIDNINDDDDYWIALFCEQGQSGGEAGFIFGVEHPGFIKKRDWNNFANSINQSFISRLEKMGFKDQGKGKGVFFLPIHLDANSLAKTWEENGEFARDDDCFEPLREALETLKEAEGIFSQILRQASDQKTTAKAAKKA